MIYLIESSGYSVDDKDTINYFRLLKIGYTEDNKEIVDLRPISFTIQPIEFFVRFLD